MNHCPVISLFICLSIVNVDIAGDPNSQLQPSWNNRWMADKTSNSKDVDHVLHSKPYNLAGYSRNFVHAIEKFWLYTRQIVKNPELYSLNSPYPSMFIYFDNTKPTKILIHGWIESPASDFTMGLVNAFLSAHDYNIIIVDWEKLANEFYTVSRDAVPVVGVTLAKFIDLLYRTYATQPESLHLIGFSLGAHVAGVAGKFLSSGSIGRITGLDPALPMFFQQNRDRLTRDAANFVDVIHTCGNFLGWYSQTGHADFYPNNGLPIQPGCGFDGLGICSHQRSWMYYAESIGNPNNFKAYACDSWDHYLRRICNMKPVTMGENVDTSARGRFYLKTNMAKPFGRGSHW